MISGCVHYGLVIYLSLLFTLIIFTYVSCRWRSYLVSSHSRWHAVELIAKNSSTARWNESSVPALGGYECRYPFHFPNQPQRVLYSLLSYRESWSTWKNWNQCLWPWLWCWCTACNYKDSRVNFCARRPLARLLKGKCVAMSEWYTSERTVNKKK